LAAVHVEFSAIEDKLYRSIRASEAKERSLRKDLAELQNLMKEVSKPFFKFKKDGDDLKTELSMFKLVAFFCFFNHNHHHHHHQLLILLP
jgi:hypothetical protein